MSEEPVSFYLTRLVLVLVVLAATWVVAAWARTNTTAALEGRRVDFAVARFGGSFVQWALIVLVAVACLGALGIETTAFAAVLGGLAFALGLGLKDALANLVAGVGLLLFRPFRVGDLIAVGAMSGRVYAIDLFFTALDTPDNRRIVMPNGTLLKANLENMTEHPMRRVDVLMSVGRSADLDRTREVLTAAAAEVPGRVQDRPVEVALERVAGTVEWQVSVWCRTADHGVVRQALLASTKRAIDAAELPLG